MTVDAFPYSRTTYVVAEVTRYRRAAGGVEATPVADYRVRHHAGNLTVRCLADDTRARGCVAVALEPYFTHPWDDESPDILLALDDPSGSFTRWAGEPHEEVYTRLNGLRTPYLYTPLPGPGDRLVVWDYHRRVDRGGGVFDDQYLYAQFCGAYDSGARRAGAAGRGTGTITMLRGVEVHPDRLK